jgi:tetratricopeptide (TPR) repeat protein
VCGVELPPHCHGCGIEVPNGIEICIHCRTERAPVALDAQSITAMAYEVPNAVLPSGLDLAGAFVGRTAILDQLRKRFELCQEGRTFQFVAVVGKPGLGKSALVAQCAEHLKEAGSAMPPLVLFGRAGGHGAPPFAAFIRVLAQLFGFREGQTSNEAREAIIRGVAAVMPQSRVTEVAHLVGQLMRVPFAGSPVLEPLLASPAQLEMRMFIAMRRLLVAYAEQSTVVIMLDDMERATPETVNLLHYLAAGLGSNPVMALLAGREAMLDLHPRFGQGEFDSLQIDLPAFEPEEGEAQLKALLAPCGELPDEILAIVRNRRDASPRLVGELVRLLLEAGVIDAATEPWGMDLEMLERLTIAATHEGIISKRLESLAEGDRLVLEKCAACGEVFWLEAVVAIIRSGSIASGEPDGPNLEVIADTGERTHQSVTEALMRHKTRGFIVESDVSQIRGQREYRFAYPPIWNLVYERIDAVDRCRYHQVIAQWLELRPEGRNAENQEEVARHLELAGDGTAAAQRYRRAADLARVMHLNDKAIRLYRQALACLAEQDVGTRMHLWHDMGSVYALRGDYEDALAAFEKMLRLSWVMNSRSKGGVAFNKMGRIYRQKGDLELAIQYLERGHALFEQSGDQRGIAGSLDDIAQVFRLQGRYDEALDKSAVSLEQRRRIGDARSIAVSLTNIGNIERDRGLLNEAAACHEEALALRREVVDQDGMIMSLNALAIIEYVRGSMERGVELWQESLTIAEEIGAIPHQAMLLNNLGEAAIAMGETVKARQRLEEAVQLARLMDDRRVLTDALRNLSDLEVQGGNAERARELAEEAREVAKRAGMREYEGRALLSLGEAYGATVFDDAGSDSAESAKKYFAAAVELLRELDNQAELAKALSQYGEFLVERGNPDGGKMLLEEARQLFQKLGMKAREAVSKKINDLGPGAHTLPPEPTPES